MDDGGARASGVLAVGAHAGADDVDARRRRLALWFATSLLLHALLLFVAVPIAVERGTQPPELQVTLEREPPPAPPQPREPAPKPIAKAPPQKKPVEPARPQRAPAPVQERTAEAPPTQILALPQQPAAPEPAFTVPAPETAAEKPRDAGKAARAPPPEVAPATKPRLTDASPTYAPKVEYRRTAERGRVTLMVLVNREGRVAEVKLQKTSGYPNLDRHAAEEVRRWRFSPAREGNEPREQWIPVNITY